jgi:hypothetical protein
MHQPNSIMPSALHRGEVCRRIKLKLLDIINWLPIRMMYRPSSIIRNRCRLFERKRSPIGWLTGVGLCTTTSRLTELREILQQPTEQNQQQTYHNNKQNRINNRHVTTTSRTKSTTDLSQQWTEPNQQQTYRNNKQNRINNRHVAATDKTESTTDTPEQ